MKVPFVRSLAGALATLVLTACAHEVEFRPAYVPPAKPAFVAQGRLLIVMPKEPREFVYKGHPRSITGEYMTLTIPLGEIVEDVAKEVFSSCFAYGVDVVDALGSSDDFVLALEGDLEEFAYSYNKVIDQGFGEDAVEAWTVPEVDIAFHVKAYDRHRTTVLDKKYDSGVRAGESYLVTGRPAERINRVLHETLHALMLELAVDLYPLLLQECKVSVR